MSNIIILKSNLKMFEFKPHLMLIVDFVEDTEPTQPVMSTCSQV